MISNIDHLGLAVHSIATARVFYEEVLGLTCEAEEEVASQQVRTAFFTVGQTHIELLEPTDPTSPIAKFLENRGEGIHHIAYRTDDIEAQLATARRQGLRLIHESPIIGAGGKRVAFLHPKGTAGVLTEFCE
ncbi:MAG: methylmalonyl-CoA epimerase [Desulfobulbaceae bacterium]|nr:methylmalonyl-CoA epimerase [Desulfobulbaceae bacterium]